MILVMTVVGFADAFTDITMGFKIVYMLVFCIKLSNGLIDIKY